MKKMLIGLLLVASVGTMVGCTETKVVDKKGTEVAEETKEQIVEEAKEQVVIPETIEAKIGDEVVFTNRYGKNIFGNLLAVVQHG